MMAWKTCCRRLIGNRRGSSCRLNWWYANPAEPIIAVPLSHPQNRLFHKGTVCLFFSYHIDVKGGSLNNLFASYKKASSFVAPGLGAGGSCVFVTKDCSCITQQHERMNIC